MAKANKESVVYPDTDDEEWFAGRVFLATSLVEQGPPLRRIVSAPAILRAIYDEETEYLPFQLAKTNVVQLMDAQQQELAVEGAISLDVTWHEPTVDATPESTLPACVKENQMEVTP